MSLPAGSPTTSQLPHTPIPLTQEETLNSSYSLQLSQESHPIQDIDRDEEKLALLTNQEAELKQRGVKLTEQVAKLQEELAKHQEEHLNIQRESTRLSNKLFETSDTGNAPPSPQRPLSSQEESEENFSIINGLEHLQGAIANNARATALQKPMQELKKQLDAVRADIETLAQEISHVRNEKQALEQKIAAAKANFTKAEETAGE